MPWTPKLHQSRSIGCQKDLFTGLWDYLQTSVLCLSLLCIYFNKLEIQSSSIPLHNFFTFFFTQNYVKLWMAKGPWIIFGNNSNMVNRLIINRTFIRASELELILSLSTPYVQITWRTTCQDPLSLEVNSLDIFETFMLTHFTSPSLFGT